MAVVATELETRLLVDKTTDNRSARNFEQFFFFSDKMQLQSTGRQFISKNS